MIDPKCSDCGGMMKEGFVLDQGYTGVRNAVS